MRGKLFVVSGPSGVGKNTLLNAIIDSCKTVQYSVSATSRPIRPGEVDGKSYYFVSRARFEELIANDALLEYAEYVGNYYGTPLQPIREAIENGVDVVMDVEVVGALKIKKRLPDDAVLVFVTAPSFDVIRKRLVHRGDVAPGLMEERLEAEQLVARVDQALRERGKGVDRKLVRELKNQMSSVAKCVSRIKPDKLDEGQLNDLRIAVDQLKRSPALAALGGVN